MIPVNPPTSIDIDISGENINPPPTERKSASTSNDIVVSGEKQKPTKKINSHKQRGWKILEKTLQRKGGERERERVGGAFHNPKGKKVKGGGF